MMENLSNFQQHEFKRQNADALQRGVGILGWQ